MCPTEMKTNSFKCEDQIFETNKNIYKTTLCPNKSVEKNTPD